MRDTLCATRLLQQVRVSPLIAPPPGAPKGGTLNMPSCRLVLCALAAAPQEQTTPEEGRLDTECITHVHKRKWPAIIVREKPSLGIFVKFAVSPVLCPKIFLKAINSIL